MTKEEHASSQPDWADLHQRVQAGSGLTIDPKAYAFICRETSTWLATPQEAGRSEPNWDAIHRNAEVESGCKVSPAVYSVFVGEFLGWLRTIKADQMHRSSRTARMH